MRTTDWDRVMTSAPQSKQAAVVRDGQGTDNGEDKDYGLATTIAPPPLRPVPPDTEDWTGRVVGRLRVIGLIKKRKGERSSKKAAWCVKCVCGLYCRRTTKALRASAATSSGCERCNEEAYKRQHGDQKRIRAVRAAIQEQRGKS